MKASSSTTCFLLLYPRASRLVSRPIHRNSECVIADEMSYARFDLMCVQEFTYCDCIYLPTVLSYVFRVYFNAVLKLCVFPFPCILVAKFS